MSMRAFDVATMIAISGPWVNEDKDRPFLLGSPLTAGLVPLIETVHNNLLALRVESSDAEELLGTLLELESDISEEDRIRILQPLRTAESKARKKRAAGEEDDEAEKMSDDMPDDSVSVVPAPDAIM